jgi:hypothetical protein
MQTTYRPGQWYVIVLPGVLVALPPDVSGDVVARLWERMPHERALATVIDVLAAQAGGDFTSLPSFVAAVSEGTDLRIALRGEVSARVDTSTDTHEFSGAEVTTWSERFVGGASRVQITVGAAEGENELPLQSGVVRAGTVGADFEPADEWAGTTPVTDAEPADERAGTTPVTDAEPADDATMSPSEVTLAPSAEDFDELWGATVHSVPAVVEGEEVSGPVAPAPEGGDQGDHDGATISVAELRALRQHPPTSADAPTAVLPVTPGAAGRVRVSTGQVVTLDRTVIIGRRPRSTRASGANLPHLIAVDSPQQDISRSHLEIRPEGDTVVVIDLHTTNGSTLLRAGADPMRLHPGEQTLVLSGDVVDLGDGVEVTFEDLP